MRPEIVMAVSPFDSGAAGMVEAEEQAFFQQLVAHATVETLDIAILHRSYRRNVVPLDFVILRPSKGGVRGQFDAWFGSPCDEYPS
jgi:hypothetical protein